MKLTRRLVVVSGSRDYPDRRQVERVLSIKLDPGDVLMHGAARGVDTWADDVAQRIPGVVREPMPADWTKGRGAGIHRNHAMMDRAATARDLGWQVEILAFWDQKSPGTRDAAEYARSLGFEPEVWTPGGRL